LQEDDLNIWSIFVWRDSRWGNTILFKYKRFDVTVKSGLCIVMVARQT